MEDSIQATAGTDGTQCVHPASMFDEAKFATALMELRALVILECASNVSALAENTQELKLCMGEMSAQELRTLRSGLRLAAHKLGLLKAFKRKPRKAARNKKPDTRPG